MRLFNRVLPRGHPWAGALRGLFKRGAEGRAVGRNLQSDGRVSVDREKVFVPYLAGRPSAKAANRAVVDYFQERVRGAKKPDFIEPPLNARNIVSGAVGDTEYATLIDLSRLTGVLQAASEPEFETFPADPDASDDIRTYFAVRRNGPATDWWKFVEAILKLLNSNRPFHPLWIMPVANFGQFRKEPASRWCEVMGIPVEDDVPHLVIVLYCTLRELGGDLVRPTCLDTNWNGRHFPSPPWLPVGDGGYAMDLQTDPAPTQLHAEFIHEQPYYSPRQLERSNYASGWAGPLSGSLVDQRMGHRELLSVKHPISNWMDPPI